MPIDNRSLIEYLRDGNTPLLMRLQHAIQYRGTLGTAFCAEAEILLAEAEKIHEKANELKRAARLPGRNGS